MLKRLGGMSRSAIEKTRSLLGNEPVASSALREVRVVGADDHPVTRKLIGRNALKVLDRLHENGHRACLVGGGVRDALVGLKPKDFDVATDASPEQVRSLFRNSRIIGRRFRLVHVVYGREIIEVATFRAAHNAGEGGETAASGRIVRDNVFGTIEEDAIRRDFSVNGLYWDVADGSVVDYVGGLDDVEARVFRLIGDPLVRCEEDPVRVLRAVRLAAKLDFSIEKSTLAAMQQVSPELGKTAPARLFDEVLKLFQGGYAEASFDAVRDHDLLQHLFPALQRRLRRLDEAAATELESLLRAALVNTDRRVSQGKPITPAYLLAFMLWPEVEEAALAAITAGEQVHDALHAAAEDALSEQIRATSIPKRFTGPMKEIWQMQPRLERYRGSRALSLMEDRRFRAAYDFLCLRATIDPELEAVAEWWTEVQTIDDQEQQQSMAASRPVASHVWGELPTGARKKRRGGTRRRRRSSNPGAEKQQSR